MRVQGAGCRVQGAGCRSGNTRAEDAQGKPTKSHISPSTLVYEDKFLFGENIKNQLAILDRLIRKCEATCGPRENLEGCSTLPRSYTHDFVVRPAHII